MCGPWPNNAAMPRSRGACHTRHAARADPFGAPPPGPRPFWSAPVQSCLRRVALWVSSIAWVWEPEVGGDKGSGLLLRNEFPPRLPPRSSLLSFQ